MRVVQLLTQSEGGPADHAADLAAGLAAAGHDSHVVGPVSRGTSGAVRAGVVWHDLRMTDKRDLRGAGGVLRTVRALAPDVLHLQDRRAGMLGRLLAPTARRTRVVYTLHGVADGLSDLVAGNLRAAPRRRRDRFYYLRLERLLARLGDRVVVPSDAVARFARDHVGLPAAGLDVVPNGVDPRRFRPAPARGRAPTVDVVWLGGLVPVKRPDLLLEAVAALPDVRATLVGGGELEDVVRRQCDRLGLDARVRILGHREDPAPELAAADLYALTSVAENCPLALLQAMASGLPVVVPAVGGVPEVVRDGVEGLVLPPGDPAALTEALGRLVGDPDLRDRMGRASRERVLAGFTLDHCVERMERCYERAVAQG